MLCTLWIVWLLGFWVIILADIPAWLTDPNWVEFATLGGIILVSLFTLVKLIDARYSQPGRVFDLQFLDHASNFPPTPVYGQSYRKSIRKYDGTSDLLVRIRVKQGVHLRDMELQFVSRRWRWRPFHPFDFWTWENAPTSLIKISRATDAHSATISMPEEPRAHERTNLNGGSRIVYDKPNELLVGDSLWFRLEVEIQQSWQGFLQFRGPSPGGRRAYSRRKVKAQAPMRQEIDKAETQTQEVSEAYPETAKDCPGC